jgi:hypothetical protein
MRIIDLPGATDHDDDPTDPAGAARVAPPAKVVVLSEAEARRAFARLLRRRQQRELAHAA